MAGRPSSATARTSAPASSTPTKGATFRPRSRRKVFSVSRSWVSASARTPGRTGRRSARNSTVAVGTFSNSKVDDVDGLGEAGERRLVVERGDGPRRGGVIGRRRRLGGEDMGAQADFERRHRQHAPELAGAENADRRAGA